MVAKFLKLKGVLFIQMLVLHDRSKQIKKSKKIKVISYEEMLEMASLGAKVMQPVSIQDARLNRIDVEVKSSFKKKSGTLITKRSNINNNKIVTGISSTQNDSKVSLIGVKDKPGVAASIFKPLSKNLINVDWLFKTFQQMVKRQI